jgi:hypothetical protein
MKASFVCSLNEMSYVLLVSDIGTCGCGKEILISQMFASEGICLIVSVRNLSLSLSIYIYMLTGVPFVKCYIVIYFLHR